MLFHLLETATEGGISPWWVGGAFFAVMVCVLLLIINYGKGHPHV